MVFTSVVPLAELTGVESAAPHPAGGRAGRGPPGARAGDPAAGRRAAASGQGRGRRTPSWRTTSAPDTADSVRAVHGLLQRVLQCGRDAASGATAAALAREMLEGPAAQAGAPRRPPAGSAASSRPPAAARSREKMVWDWPDVGDRIVEERR